jgi:putative DNA primase/helicase
MKTLTLETIRAALHCIPADMPRNEWARIAMALKSELGDAGFELFDTWSQDGATYNAKATRETWRSVKAGGRVRIAGDPGACLQCPHFF